MRLPRGWRIETVSELAQGGLFVDGDWVETKDQDPDGSVRLTQLADVGIAKFRDRSDRWMREDQAAALGCTFLRSGDVLIARMPEPLGRACIVPASIGQAVTAVDVAVLRVAREDVEPRFVMWALNSPLLMAQMVGLQSGTTRGRISRRNLGTVRIPIPMLPEQRDIVESLEDHLSRLDAATAQLSSAERRLEAWKRQSLDRLVRETASGTTTLRTLVRRIEAGRSFGGSAPPAALDQWGIIKVSAMTWGEFRPEENKAVPPDKVDPRYEIRPGDVLVSRANTTDYVGAPVLVGPTRSRLLLSDKSLRVVPAEGVEARWLATVLAARSSRQQVSKLATGTKDSMRNISQPALLSITVPSATRTQQAHVMAHAALLEGAADRVRAQLSAAQVRATYLRQSLLAAAFSGRVTNRSRTHPLTELINV